MGYFHFIQAHTGKKMHLFEYTHTHTEHFHCNGKKTSNQKKNYSVCKAFEKIEILISIHWLRGALKIIK